MKSSWFVGALVGLAVVASGPAAAGARHKAKPRCVEQPQTFSLGGFLFNQPPKPNGCAPPVYVGGVYVGQDPDPFIRQQLERDPSTGYASYLSY